MATGKVQFFVLGILALFTSCDVVRYVGVNNYTSEPKQVVVGFTKTSDIIWESDTLNIGAIGADSFSNVLIRQNLTSESYTFLVPDSTHVELMPKGIANPFNWVKIVNQGDTTHYNLRDKAQLKQLKKQGIIETSGIPESMFLINIGKP